MIEVKIPGKGNLVLQYLVLDFNGTMALDGVLLPGVKERLNELAKLLDIFVLTADTFGTGRTACEGIRARVEILTEHPGGPAKQDFIEKLGPEVTTAVGNGANDSLMLAGSALGIMVLGPEGASAKTLQAADVIVTDINHGLDMLLQPKRLIATLRS